MKNIKFVAATGLIMMSLSGCGGGGSTTGELDDDDTPAPSQPSMITGTLLAPDNSTPIAGATVYTLDSSGQAMLSLLAADDCPQPTSAYLDYTCTGPDGSFQLPAPAGSQTAMLGIKKGFFESQTQVTLVDGQTTVGNLVLPAEPANGAGRFAVIEGAFDRMEDILAKLGLGEVNPVTFMLEPGTETFDLFSESMPLFEDNDSDGQADIFNYDVVFINCGQFDEETILASYRQTLHDYVTLGGVLYVTDQAYDFVEQVFPEYLDFYGDDGVAAATAETLHQAEVGEDGIQVNATISDQQLLDWLAIVTCNNGPCLNSDNTVTIGGFWDGWTVLNGAHAGMSNNVTVWTSGGISYFDSGAGLYQENVQKPLTVTMNIGQGKVLYSSYHTDESSFSAGFDPQDRILQYLIFEL